MPNRKQNANRTPKDGKKREKTRSKRRFFGLKPSIEPAQRAPARKADIENPFVDPEKPLFPGPERVEVDFSSLPVKYPVHPTYMEILNQGAMEFPWFHEYEFEGSKTVKQALKLRAPTAIRRVLLAYMGGGTKDEIAARVPTSKSTIFKIVRREIYGSTDARRLLELGLIRLWDVPVAKVEKVIGASVDVVPDEMPVVCLVCHRVVSFIYALPRKHDFSLVNNPEEYWPEPESRQEAYIKGHLIKHFPFSRKLLAPNKSTYYEFLGRRSAVPGRKPAIPWFNLVEDAALSVALDDDHLFTPNVPGRIPTDMEVHRFYQQLLKST